MRIPIDGRHLAYDHIGEGRPALLVHAFPLDRRMWAPQGAALAAVCHCLLPDVRGFGESDAAPPYGVDRYADDLVALLDTLDIRERVVLGGLSMGSHIAFACWRHHRDRVHALILAGARAGPDSEQTRARRLQIIAAAREQGTAAVATMLAGTLVGATTRARNPQLVTRLHQMIGAASVDGIVGASQAMMARPDSTPLLATIDVPTLIIVGAEDTLAPPSEAEALHAGVRDSRLEVIPGAGHVCSIERPAAFNQVVTEFLQDVG
jgi:pimeloyl-ACP methyl ester carboxylesterase